MTRKPLREIPRNRQPLSFETYSALYDKIAVAEERFDDLGLSDLAAEMDAVNTRLTQAWSAITTAEREGR